MDHSQQQKQRELAFYLDFFKIGLVPETELQQVN